MNQASSPEDSPRRADGWLLFLSALALRAAWAFAAHRAWGYRDDGFYDDGVYLEFARHFFSSGMVTHPPLYSLVLAPFVAGGGDLGVTLATWTQILLSAATPVLVYRLAFRLRQPRAAALVAGALTVLGPMFVFFSSRVASETLFLALTAGFFLAWLGAWERGRARDAALAGVLGGLATLTRGVILPFGGVLALVALVRRREQPRWASLMAACGLAWAATIAPWTARNWVLTHRFIAVSKQGGVNMYQGLELDPAAVAARAARMGEETRALGLGTVEADDYWAAKARAWVREHPAEFAKLCLAKLVRFWRAFPEPPHPRAESVLVGLFTLLCYALALLGLRAGAAAPGGWFALAWIAYLNLLHSVVSSNMRYRLPADVVIAILAGAGAAELARRAQARRKA